MKHIGIDLSSTAINKAGVGTYSHELVKNLSFLDKKNNYLLFPFFHHIFDPDFKKIKAPDNAENMQVMFDLLPKEWAEYLWKKSWIPREKFLNNLDLIHVTTFVTPPNYKGKLVTTIYDVTFKTYPEFHTPANVHHCDSGTRTAVERADAIITISQNSKKDIVEIYKCSPEKIHVTLLGYEEKFKPCSDEAKKLAIKNKYQIKNNFLLSVGTIEPRKNLLGTLRAYLSLPEKLRDNLSIIVAGNKGWLNSQLFSFVEENNLKDKVKFLGFVDENDLPTLYSLATIFIYPSFYEGFGLPVIEAMAGGCPVICSNTSSLPEVAGNAAELIDPYNQSQFNQALKNLLTDEKKREKMREKGLKHCRDFSWRKCARQTLDIYQNLLQ